MTLDLFIVVVCCILGLLAHGARGQAWLAWVLRTIIGIFFFVELLSCLGLSLDQAGSQFGVEVLTAGQWALAVMACLCASTGLLLFYYMRLGLSFILKVLDQIVCGAAFVLAFKRENVFKNLGAVRLLEAKSMPHLVALWIYVTSACFLLGLIDPRAVKLPLLPLAIPLPLEQLFSYNGLGLVALSLCGVGIFVSRKPQEAFARLGWAKPTLPQVGIAVALIFITFAYDYLWSLFTHQMEGGLALKLSNYNAGTFTAGGAFAPSLVLALFTGICAGAGEETLIRGALQPVFGILPAALLHGLLHGQFSHAPVFLVQVAAWSVIMGIVKRYTNTTTTMIAHAGFNFITAFLFAFNP